MKEHDITKGVRIELDEEQGRTLWTAVTVIKWASVLMFIGAAVFVAMLVGFRKEVDTQAVTINDFGNQMKTLKEEVAFAQQKADEAKAETIKNRDIGYKNAARHCANAKALGVPIHPGTEPGDCYSAEVLAEWDPASIPVAATKEQLQAVADRNFALTCSLATPENRAKAGCPLS
jgi:hypothetical protein